MAGSKKELRPGVWRFHVYAGLDPDAGRKRQATRTFRGGKREADDALARFVTEVRDGLHERRDGTVAELLDRWMAHATLAPATRTDYESAIRVHIKPHIGDRNVQRLRTSDLDNLYRRLEVGPARVRRVHNILNVALAQAVRWQELNRNPARDATPPPVQRQAIASPERDQVAQLLDLATEADPGLHCFVYLSAVTGARRGEVCGLQWGDLDPAGHLRIARSIVLVPGHILVEPTKTRRVRTVSLDAATLAVLAAWRTKSREEALAWGAPLDGVSFVFHRPGEPLTPWRPDVVTHRFVELRDTAGMPGVKLHHLRHFVASQLLAGGEDAVTVAGRLGHARPSTTTDMYGHVVAGRDREAAERIGRIVGG